MDNLRDQIFQVTNDFLAEIRQLTQRHTELVVQETLSALGNPPKKDPAPRAPKAQGLKRGPDEINQLSERFVQFVSKNPGLRIEQINKELGTTTAELALPIRKLIISGALSVKGAKRSTTYFAGAGAEKTPGTPATEENGKKRSRAKKSKKSKARSRSKG